MPTMNEELQKLSRLGNIPKPIPLPIMNARPYRAKKRPLCPLHALFILAACFAAAWLITWASMELSTLLK